MAMASRALRPTLLAMYVAIFVMFTRATKEAASQTVGLASTRYASCPLAHPLASGHLIVFKTCARAVQLLGGYDISPLPYLALVNSSNFTGGILNGVNFASGGAGLAKDIDQSFYGRVISLEEQIQQFATVQGNITALLGKSKGDLLLQNSMYIISIGSNDIMTYIFTRPMPPDQFVANLTNTYAIHLKNLYSLGARKFGILSIAPIGCCPMARSFSGGACSNETNNLAQACYGSFKSLLQIMSQTLNGFKYSLANTYNMTMNVINNPSGFKDVKSACCGNTTSQGVSECKKGVHLCTNRDDNLFWDAFHPTEKAAKLAATALVFSQDPNFVSPINFGSLRTA